MVQCTAPTRSTTSSPSRARSRCCSTIRASRCAPATCWCSRAPSTPGPIALTATRGLPSCWSTRNRSATAFRRRGRMGTMQRRINREAEGTFVTISNSALDTRFRSALERMAERGRLQSYSAPADPHLEIAGMMKKLDGGPALLFGDVIGHDVPVVGNLLSCQANCEAAFGTDFRGIRDLIGRALGDPKPPVLVEKAPAQEVVHTEG